MKILIDSRNVSWYDITCTCRDFYMLNTIANNITEKFSLTEECVYKDWKDDQIHISVFPDKFSELIVYLIENHKDDLEGSIQIRENKNKGDLYLEMPDNMVISFGETT